MVPTRNAVLVHLWALASEEGSPLTARVSACRLLLEEFARREVVTREPSVLDELRVKRDAG